MWRKVMLSIFASFGLSLSAGAFTECTKSVRNVWTATDGGVWVCFHEVGGCIKWSGTQFSEEVRNRFYSQVVTALAADRKLTIRYPEDTLDCAAQPTRGDFVGLWLQDLPANG